MACAEPAYARVNFTAPTEGKLLSSLKVGSSNFHKELYDFFSCPLEGHGLLQVLTTLVALLHPQNIPALALCWVLACAAIVTAGEVTAGGEQGSAEGGRQTADAAATQHVASSMLSWPSVFSWSKLNLQKALLLPAARGEAESPAAASASGPNSTADQFVFLVLHDKGSCPNNKYQVDHIHIALQSQIVRWLHFRVKI